MRILFTGGGTGGHIYPLIAVMRDIKRLAEQERVLDLELFYMGPKEYGADTLRDEEVYVIITPSGKLRNYFSVMNFLDFFKTAYSLVKAFFAMFFIMPDVIFSKGGYGALPAVCAAWLFRIPLIIHESDTVPGRVNRFSARFAKRIGIAFPAAQDYFPKEKTAFVGIPIRRRILGGNRDEAKNAFNIYTDLPVVGVMGASQGSQKINRAILDILRELTDEYEVAHQTGENNFEDIRGQAGVILESANKSRYRAFGIMDESEMRDFYLVSDIIVSRASATSIYEIAAWGKPSIMIPLRIATQDHQTRNAYEYASEGACIVIEENNLTPHILLAEIHKIVKDPERKKRMSEAAVRFSRVDSSEIIARELLKVGLHE